jgi:hypothetical protein
MSEITKESILQAKLAFEELEQDELYLSPNQYRELMLRQPIDCRLEYDDEIQERAEAEAQEYADEQEAKSGKGE